MARQEFKAKGKAHTKMTRDGLVETDAATGSEQRISKREQDFSFHDKAGEPEKAAPRRDSTKRSGSRQTAGRRVEDSAAPPADRPEAGATNQNSRRTARYAAEPASGADAPASGKLQFSADETPVADLRVEKAERKALRYEGKLDRARENLPTKKKRRIQREFDVEADKPRFKLKTEEVVLPNGKPPGAASKIAGSAATAASLGVHNEIRKVEHENVGVEAGHKVEMGGERLASKSYNTVRQRIKSAPARKVARLERKTTKANATAAYRRALQNDPKLRSNPLSRIMQKRKIQKQYAAAKRAASQGQKLTVRVADALKKMGAAMLRLVTSNKPLLIIILAVAMLLIMIFGMFSSCSTFFTGTSQTVMAVSYMAEDADIDNAELAYTEWETDLKLEIAGVESSRPGYDEYRYNIADIGHNPYELMAFLTAVYENFTFQQVEPVLRGIFSQQYTLTYTEETETRYNDPDDENGDGDLEEYEWKILKVNLRSVPMAGILAPMMNTVQAELYGIHLEIRGNRQYVASPFDFDWLPFVSDGYGWRIHPIDGTKDYHKAADIAVASGTPIMAGFDGTVTTAASDDSYGLYVVVEDAEGLVTKYAHCSSLAVSAGQQVKKGDVIARVGSTGDSTGPHVHLEIIKNGQYLNPYYFLENPYSTGVPGMPGGPDFPADPGAAMGDGSYAALIAEAEKYLGWPYVWGGSSPSTSFDCSGFVCWCLNQSGAASVGRTTAQGLYNLCTPVSRDNARPGDLVFFTGTYSTPNPVSHVGIYVGGGRMIHCGDPISYTSIDTAFWQGHFYAFGRL